MRKLFNIILFIICIPLISLSLTPGTYIYKTYWAYNGNTVKLAWNESAGANNYDVKVEHAETEQLLDVGSTSDLTIEYILPKTGHYIFRVRATNEHGASAWALTTNPDYVVGRITFWIYSQIPPVGGVGID